MITLAPNIRVYLATGHTDMRKGMNNLALVVQEKFSRDPHAGDLFVLRGARGDKLKAIWFDGIGMSLYLKQLEGFTRFLEDGQLCLSNNAAERALRHIACGRKSWMFCGSDRGGQRAAAMHTLIATCRLNDVDPEAWLAYTGAHRRAS